MWDSNPPILDPKSSASPVNAYGSYEMQRKSEHELCFRIMKYSCSTLLQKNGTCAWDRTKFNRLTAGPPSRGAFTCVVKWRKVTESNRLPRITDQV